MGEPIRLLDVNVLVALSVDVHVHHAQAHAALIGFSAGWATCPLTEAALLRLLLNPASTGRRVGGAEAMEVMRGIRAQPSWQFVDDTSSLAQPHIDTTPLVGGKQVTDFHLVNLAAENGMLLATFDSRISGALASGDRRHVELIGASGSALP
ncbi:MAG: TA system VapC family ribonuclease toxin [Nakamurella sp.]